MKILYTARATASGSGRDGKVRSSDGMIDTAVATPVEMGGAGGHTNPEQFFAAGYATCFHNALRLVARRAKVDLEGSEVTAEVGIGSAGAGAFDLTVLLRAHLVGVDRDQAERLVAAAHQVCPYSRATRGNIDVTIEIT